MSTQVRVGVGWFVQDEGRASQQQRGYELWGLPPKRAWLDSTDEPYQPYQSRRVGSVGGTAYRDVFRALSRDAPEYPGATGASVPFVVVGFISGVTKDVADAPLGNVTLNVFRTVDDVRIVPPGEFQSETDGTYRVGVGAGNHYIYAHKAGAPDVAGATDNDLVGT